MEHNNKICIYHHLGLGDSFECNGMVRHYSEIYSGVDIFAGSNYYDIIKYMYRDNPRIFVNKIDKEKEYQQTSEYLSKYTGEILVPGHENYFSNISLFKKNKWGPAESFYFLANVPWKYRNEKFYIKRNLQREREVLKKLNPNNEKFIFIHDDLDRGFIIDLKSDKKIIRNNKNINILDLILLLENASEIHCMSSSILCLIDCLSSSLNFNNLYLHYNVRKVQLGPNSLFADWKIV